MDTANTQRLVGISLSAGADLAALGFGAEHLLEISVLVARTALRLETAENADTTAGTTRWNLAFGGDLRPDGLTWGVFDVARGEGGGTRRLYSYLAWPHYLTLSKSHEAELIHCCNFVRISPRDAGFAALDWDQPPDAPALREVEYLSSRCLTAMREKMTHGGEEVLDGDLAPRLTARIILGGKLTGYGSFMPGLFEELLLAHEHRVPLYVLGGFGGAAGVLARAIADAAGSPLPQELGLDWQRAHTDTVNGLIAAYGRHPDIAPPASRYDALAAAVSGLRDEPLAADTQRLPNGLTRPENRELMTTQDPGIIRRLLALGLSHLGGAQRPS